MDSEKESVNSFKGTYLFLTLVLLLGGFAVYDFQSNEKSIEQKQVEKQLFTKFKLNEINAFKIKGPQNFHLKKIENQWHLVAPIADLADEQEVRSLLREFIVHKVARVPREEVESFDDYGFAEPLAKIEIDTNEKITLLVGSKRSFDHGYYLKKSNSEDLFIGSSELTPLINQLYTELRNLRAYTNSNKVKEFHVMGPESLNLVLEEGVWKLDDDKSYTLSQQTVRDYLSQILNLEASSVSDDGAPLRSPDFKITVKGMDDKKWQARIWSKGDEGADLIVNNENKVYKITKEAYSFLDRKKSELKEGPKDTNKDKTK